MKAPYLQINTHIDMVQMTYTANLYSLVPISTSIIYSNILIVTNNVVANRISTSLSLSPVSTSTITGIASYNIKITYLNAAPGQFYQVYIPLTWGLNPSTVISYSMINNGLYPVPSFVIFDSTNGSINFTVPSSGYDLIYSFNLYSFVPGEGNGVNHNVFIYVSGSFAWSAINWIECETFDMSKWKTWITGYSLSTVVSG